MRVNYNDLDEDKYLPSFQKLTKKKSSSESKVKSKENKVQRQKKDD